MLLSQVDALRQMALVRVPGADRLDVSLVPLYKAHCQENYGRLSWGNHRSSPGRGQCVKLVLGHSDGHKERFRSDPAHRTRDFRIRFRADLSLIFIGQEAPCQGAFRFDVGTHGFLRWGLVGTCPRKDPHHIFPVCGDLAINGSFEHTTSFIARYHILCLFRRRFGFTEVASGFALLTPQQEVFAGVEARDSILFPYSICTNKGHSLLDAVRACRSSSFCTATLPI